MIMKIEDETNQINKRSGFLVRRAVSDGFSSSKDVSGPLISPATRPSAAAAAFSAEQSFLHPSESQGFNKDNTIALEIHIYIYMEREREMTMRSG